MCCAGMGFKSPIDETMWFISYLLLWYVVFYFVFIIKVSNQIKVLLMILISVSCYFFIIIALPQIKIIKYYSLCFTVGVLIGHYYDKIKSRELKNLKILNYITLCLGIFTIAVYICINQNNIFSMTLSAIGVMSIFTVMNLYNLKLNFLKFIGDISFEIYLIEWMFIEKYFSIFRIFPNQISKDIICFITIFLMAVLLKNVFAKYYKKIEK
jgi:peptidoglycan/LPS O-acetylase OafA/YrhL